MAAYTYTGDDARYYPAQGVEAEPGVSADFDTPPSDGRWRLGTAAATDSTRTESKEV